MNVDIGLAIAVAIGVFTAGNVLEPVFGQMVRDLIEGA